MQHGEQCRQQLQQQSLSALDRLQQHMSASAKHMTQPGGLTWAHVCLAARADSLMVSAGQPLMLQPVAEPV
jgi:hypothetical protein